MILVFFHQIENRFAARRWLDRTAVGQGRQCGEWTMDRSWDRSSARPRRHVLLVEDEALISAMTAMALADIGFCVHTAATGAAALRHLGEGAPVDILFTDLNLADDISGETVARRARELRPGLPVAFASGTATGVAAPVPGSVFFAKPYAVDHVCATLARMAAGQDGGQSVVHRRGEPALQPQAACG
jgi:DNA-binding NtrC family response regulator